MAYPKMNVKNSVLKQGVHYMTSDYKSRNKSRPTHSGIDIIGKDYACDFIVAIADGKVTKVDYDSSRGYWVEILHNSGLSSVYYHMKAGSIVVKQKAEIKKGDKIGYMGTTGHSTGNHLHFGVYEGGTNIDPLPYLEGTKSLDGKIVSKKAYSGTFPTLPKRGYFQKGDKGVQVGNLQLFLNWYGNYGLEVDKSLGEKTKSAIEKFEKSENLKVDGLFGSACLTKAKSIKK